MKYQKSRRVFAFLTCLLLLCTMPGLTSLAESAGSLGADDSESSTDETSSPDLSGITTFTFEGDSVTVTEGNSSNYEVVVYDDTDTETAPSASLDNDGNIVYSVPDGSTGELRVSIKKKGDSYAFTGSGYGSISVKKEAVVDAVIYLNGLTLESAFTAVISVGKNSSATCTIHVVDGTENTLTDSAYNNDDTYPDNAAAENAVIKCKDASDVTITGTGTLFLSGNGKNGIKANNLLTIEEVTLVIEALDNGISCENSITIHSGDLSITTAEGDGIKSCADGEAVGSVTINGGTIAIDAYADAIQAMVELTITGGEFSITTYGGYDADYDGDDDSYPSAKGLKCSGSYTGTEGSEVDATECELTISGGTFDLNTADDAIHSDENLTITGGAFTIRTSDDAIHADYVTTVGTTDGLDEDVSITIDSCYEGIEGATVNIYSGTYIIYSSDDCINAANSDLTDYSYELNIFGGNIYAAANENDCLDSNGDIQISDGTIVALGAIDNTTEVNAALDCDGMLTVTRGTLLAVGMQEMMSLPGTGSQAYVTWSAAGSSTAVSDGVTSPGTSGEGTMPGSGTQPGSGIQPGGDAGLTGGVGFMSNGDTITITDADGNVLFSATLVWNSTSSATVNYVLYSDENIETGEGYTLLVNEKSGDVDTDESEDADTEVTVTLAACSVSYVCNVTGGLQVAWSEVSGATGYYVYRKISGGSYSLVKTVTDGSTVSWSDTASSFTSGEDYNYKVAAYYKADDGTITVGDSGTTRTCKYLTGGVVSSVTNLTNGQKVTWTKVTGANGYYVYRKVSDGSYSLVNTITSGSTVSWSDTSTHTSNIDYNYKVVPYFKNSLGVYTVGVSKTTKTCKYLTGGVVSSVTNLTNGQKVTWTKVTGANGYYVYRKVSDGSYSLVNTITSGSTVSWSDTSTHTSNIDYNYKVVPYFKNSLGVYTLGASRTTKTAKFLTAGSISSLANTSSGITISWSKVTGASGYYVYRKAASATSYTLVKTITSGSTVSYTDTAVKNNNNTSYTYYIQPYFKNSSGVITKAAYTTAATYRLVATSISALTNSASKKMTVKWSSMSGVTGYKIQYSTSSSFASGNTTVTVTGASSVSSVISGLTKGKTYYVRIQTYKTVNGVTYCSAWSTVKSVKIST